MQSLTAAGSPPYNPSTMRAAIDHAEDDTGQSRSDYGRPIAIT